MDKMLRAYYESALRLKLPTQYQPETSIVFITIGKKRYFFIHPFSVLNVGSSCSIARNKASIHVLLSNAGFSLPKAAFIHADDHAIIAQLVSSLRFPVVAKPILDTYGGTGIVCNLKTVEELSTYLQEKFSQHPFMQVEEFQQGLREYRVLLLSKKVIGVVERTPATIVGDGERSIQTLIQELNDKRLRTNLSLLPLQITEDHHRCLQDQGYTLESVPAPGTQVKLSYVVNRALGGHMHSLGKKIHPENAKRLAQVVKLLGLELAGIDILCEDINKPFSKTRWFILEVNYGPGITMHEVPDSGEKVMVSDQIIKRLIAKHPLTYCYLCIKRFLARITR